MSDKGMTLRGAVVFAILMGADDVMSKAPDYVMKKLRMCEQSVVPETLLDSGNLGQFRQYKDQWEGYGPVDWDTRRDLHDLPIAEVAKKNRGETV